MIVDPPHPAPTPASEHKLNPPINCTITEYKKITAQYFEFGMGIDIGIGIGFVFMFFFLGLLWVKTIWKSGSNTIKECSPLKGWLEPQNLEFHTLQLPYQNKTCFLIISATNCPKCLRTLRTLKTLKSVTSWLVGTARQRTLKPRWTTIK